MELNQRTAPRTVSVNSDRRGTASARFGVILGIMAVLLLVACSSAPATAPSVPESAPSSPSSAAPRLSQSPEPTAGLTTNATPESAEFEEPKNKSDSDAITTIRIVEGSSARFRVNEQLARRNLPNDAVSETNVIEGAFVFDSMGNVLSEQSIVVVNLRCLKSDQSKRDNFLRQRSLESNTFPNATFVLRETDGLTWPFPDSGEHSFKMIGDLTIREITREVVWETTMRVDGDSVFGEAKTVFTFDYFEIEKPSLAFLLSVADDIGLELELVAEITSGR